MNSATDTPRTIRRGLAVLVAAGLLAACGGSDDDVGDDAVSDTTAADAAVVDDDRDDDADSAESATEPTTASTGLDVANADYLGSYTLVDDDYGTSVDVTVTDGLRTIESNTLPNHETGEFPNSGNPNEISEQDRVWEFTTEPVYTGDATWAREPGVALNGVKFEPETAETVGCSTGESYRIEGLQDSYDLGMDFNNAHVQPTGEYHYHGASEMLAEAFDNDADLVLVGFAADGHLMYYSKSAAYSSSYVLSTDGRTGTDCTYRNASIDIAGTTPDGVYVSDWVYVDGEGDLDECNGTEIDGEYAYLVTDAYPYVSRCLMGEFTNSGPSAAPAGGAPDVAAGGEGPAGGLPDLSDAAAALGIDADELGRLLGGPPPDIDAAASALGLSSDELVAVLTQHGVAPPTT